VRYASNPIVDAYVAGVLDGSVLVNELARLAIERHVADLDRWPSIVVRGITPEETAADVSAAREAARARGDEFYFDEDAAQAFLDFYTLCRHVEGELAGQEFVPLPYQAAVDWISHGWMRTATGSRRFKERWIEEPRGNGKSFWQSCHELGMIVADQEPGAKAYSLATEKQQAAAAVWGIAAEIVRQSPDLVEELEVQDSFNNHRIFVPGTGCEFRPLKSDPKRADSLNPHSISCDEVHEWPKRELYTKLRTAIGKRRQAMLTNITTAGDDRPGTVYEELHDHAVRVLRGWQDRSFEDNEFFAIVFAIDNQADGCDEDADAYDEGNLYRANPALGHPGTSVRIEYLRSMANRARVEPEVERDYLRLHLGRRVSAKVKPIPDEQWKECGAPSRLEGLLVAGGEQGPEAVLGAETARILRLLGHREWSAFDSRPCFAGIDLSSSRDLTALTLYWPPWAEWPFETYRFFAWLPQENLEECHQRDHAPYDQWVREGWLELTAGDEIDEEFVLKRAVEVSEKYAVIQWAYDPWHAVRLQHAMFAATGIEMVKFVQNLPNFGEPTQLFLDSVKGKQPKLIHDGNPLARWCASNLVTKEDAHGNKRPHKKLSNYRIDPIVAAIMARGRAIVTPTAPPKGSIYEDRGVRFFG